MDTRDDLSFIWGKETEPWFVGAFKNNSIYILNPDAYETESSHKKDEFWINLKHEYCHSYYTQLTKSHYPVWLNEGLASTISGKKLILKEGQADKLLEVFNYFDKVDKDVYGIGQFWVEYLITKYGKDKFLKLINTFSSGVSKQKFFKEFYNVYNFKFNKKTFSKFIN